MEDELSLSHGAHNTSCHFGVFMARHLPSWFCFHVTLKNVGGVDQEVVRKQKPIAMNDTWNPT